MKKIHTSESHCITNLPVPKLIFFLLYCSIKNFVKSEWDLRKYSIRYIVLDRVLSNPWGKNPITIIYFSPFSIALHNLINNKINNKEAEKREGKKDEKDKDKDKASKDEKDKDKDKDEKNKSKKWILITYVLDKIKCFAIEQVFWVNFFFFNILYSWIFCYIFCRFFEIQHIICQWLNIQEVNSE